MTTKDTSMQNVIGKAKELSAGDVSLLKKAYCETKYTPQCEYLGKKYNLKDTKQEKGFWYTCKVLGDGTVGWELSGCIGGDGKNYGNGDKYKEDEYVLQCIKTDKGVSTKLVGCLDDQSNEVAIGKRWSTGKDPFKFIKECQSDGKSIGGAIVQCSFNDKGNTGTANLGCASKAGNVLLKCINKGGGGVSVATTAYSDAAMKAALAEGLKSC